MIKTNKCRECKNLMTWAELRVQYKRLVNAGIGKNEMKVVLPRCQKCVTRYLRIAGKDATMTTAHIGGLEGAK